MRPPGSQRVKAALLAPGQEGTQVRLGMAARLAPVPGEATRDRQPQRIDPPLLVDREDGKGIRCGCHDRASARQAQILHSTRSAAGGMSGRA
jgi:hypothetical protein